MKCEHNNFHCNCEIGRLQASETDTTIIGFSADIRIKCSDCGLPFEFVGVECGLLPDRPTASFDFQELRVPILPKGEQLPPAVRHGFVIRPVRLQSEDRLTDDHLGDTEKV